MTIYNNPFNSTTERQTYRHRAFQIRTIAFHVILMCPDFDPRTARCGPHESPDELVRWALIRWPAKPFLTCPSPEEATIGKPRNLDTLYSTVYSVECPSINLHRGNRQSVYRLLYRLCSTYSVAEILQQKDTPKYKSYPLATRYLLISSLLSPWSSINPTRHC